jgi:SAM-dependent methyltransferase
MNQETESLPEDFLLELKKLEEAYLAQEDPILQSGFRGGETRWRKERILILEAVDSDGDFLDVGCANGYLLQCLLEWAKEKGITLTPYGVDQGSGLIKLARKRLPEYASHFWVANAWSWVPPRKFRYVYTLYDCVPENFLNEYVGKLLERYVENNGTLIIGAYGSYSKNQPARDIGKDLSEFGYCIAGNASCGTLPISRIAWIKVNNSL